MGAQLEQRIHELERRRKRYRDEMMDSQNRGKGARYTRYRGLYAGVVDELRHIHPPMR